MNAVITVKQAKQITGGRTALVPLEYEAAINALIACTTLDEAKYWDNKADALAAWAKIYRSDDATRKAKLLKLHAFRRMGELAAQIRPDKRNGNRGSLKGSVSLLVEHGLKSSAADAARVLARLTPDEFGRVVNRDNPPSPSVARYETLKGSLSYKAMLGPSSAPSTFRSFCRRHIAKDLARTLSGDEVSRVRELIIEVSDWLDEFERVLPKETQK